MFELLVMLAGLAHVIAFLDTEVEFVMGDTHISLNWADQQVYVEDWGIDWFAVYRFTTPRLAEKVSRDLRQIAKVAA